MDENYLLDFMKVSHELGLTDAISYVQHLIYPMVSLSNVLDLVQVADIYDMKSLKKYCIYFISIDFDYIAKKIRFGELSPELRKEIERHKHIDLSKVKLQDIEKLEQDVNQFDEDLRAV